MLATSHRAYRSSGRLILVGLDHLRPKDPVISLGIASIVAQLKRNDLLYTNINYNCNTPPGEDSFNWKKVV